jgi:hypothetical protein
MTTVRIIYPQIKLAKLLAEPGSPPVAELLNRAERQTQKAKLEFEGQLLKLIAELEVSLARAESLPGSEWVNDVFSLAASGIGSAGATGIRGVDEVFRSLCTLTARCETADRADVRSLGTHVAVLIELVRNKPMSQPAVDQLLGRLNPGSQALPHEI